MIVKVSRRHILNVNYIWPLFLQSFFKFISFSDAIKTAMITRTFKLLDMPEIVKLSFLEGGVFRHQNVSTQAYFLKFSVYIYVFDCITICNTDDTWYNIPKAFKQAGNIARSGKLRLMNGNSKFHLLYCSGALHAFYIILLYG